LSWTPEPSDAGDYDVGFRASNALATTAHTLIHVTPVGSADPMHSLANGDRPAAVHAALPPGVFAARLAPNPLVGAGALTFAVTRAGAVKIELFEVSGRHVGTLHDGWAAAGVHAVPLEPRRLPPGTYFYRLQAAEGSKQGRFVVLE